MASGGGWWVTSDANLESWLSWTLVVDSDGNTVPSPGDVVRFEGAVVNSGLAASDDIEVVLPLDAHSTLNVGGLSSSAGSIGSAEVDGVTEVTVSLTSLASNTTLLFDVEVTVGFLAAFEQVLAVQGEVSHDGTPWGFTDDPQTLTVSDATVVPVSTTPWPERGDYTGPFPEVAITAPTGGARVATLTDVTGTVEATDGEEIVFWRLSLSAAGSEASVVLGEGFEEPSSADLGTLDPSLLQNGLWVLRLDAIDSGGLLGWTESPIEVAGDFKPGAMRVSFLDASYALPTGGDVSLVRTYDTLDRHERGDFGYGWNLSVLDLRVQTNGPLGEVCCGCWKSELFTANDALFQTAIRVVVTSSSCSRRVRTVWRSSETTFMLTNTSILLDIRWCRTCSTIVLSVDQDRVVGVHVCRTHNTIA